MYPDEHLPVKHHLEKRNTKKMNQLLIGVHEAADAVGLSHWTIRQYIRDGKVHAVRIGRRVLVEPEELRRLISESRCYVEDPEGGGNE